MPGLFRTRPSVGKRHTWLARCRRRVTDNRILFAGYTFDSETGLYHVRNRYYHEQLGWITRDPAGYMDGMSLYQYCGSNATKRWDPTGEDWWPPWTWGRDTAAADLARANAKFARETAEKLDQEAKTVKDKDPGRADDLRSRANALRQTADELDKEAEDCNTDWYWEAFGRGFDNGANAGAWQVYQAFTLGQSDWINENRDKAWSQTSAQGTWGEDVSKGSSYVAAGAGYLAGGLAIAEAAPAMAAAQLLAEAAGSANITAAWTTTTGAVYALISSPAGQRLANTFGPAVQEVTQFGHEVRALGSEAYYSQAMLQLSPRATEFFTGIGPTIPSTAAEFTGFLTNEYGPEACDYVKDKIDSQQQP